MLRLLLTLLLFLLTLTLGAWGIYHSYLDDLERHARQSAEHARTIIDSMIDQAQRANAAVLPDAGAPCANVELSLREQAALGLFIRSVNLAWKGRLYCTSLFGVVDEADEPELYTGRTLLLMKGNRVRQNHPLLVIRQERGDGVALTAIDGQSLSFMLDLGRGNSWVILQVGSVWLDGHGRFGNVPAPMANTSAVRVVSKRYPFVIDSGYITAVNWQSAWHARQMVFLMLLLISTLFAVLLWWQLGRSRSPSGELERALRAREFVPYLQPMVAGDTEQMVGVEVLMRWQHPTAGLIRPDLFIPQAEASGLILPMTSQMMQQVARSLKSIQHTFPAGFHVGFNICAAHCHDSGKLYEDCYQFLAYFEPGRVTLVLELTERELLVEDAGTLELFRRLDAMGVKLAIDDFGTGHSSLSYLQRFHVDILKIDQSFIRRIGTESLSEHIVDNVIDLASRLGLVLVAEGVETAEQASYLKAKKVDFLQGFYFGRPEPMRSFITRWLSGEAGQSARQFHQPAS